MENKVQLHVKNFKKLLRRSNVVVNILIKPDEPVQRGTLHKVYNKVHINE